MMKLKDSRVLKNKRKWWDVVKKARMKELKKLEEEKNSGPKPSELPT